MTSFDIINERFNINGFQVVLNCNGTREVVIVDAAGIEEEHEALVLATTSARNGYPVGNIDVVSAQRGRWYASGGWADEAHRCQYVN